MLNVEGSNPGASILKFGLFQFSKWLCLDKNNNLGISVALLVLNDWTGVNVITDWKTNKPKNFVSTNYTKKMLKPFEKYDDTALGHYYVQLPLYGKLLLKMLQGTKYENIKLYGCVISHLKEDSLYDEYKVPQDIVNIIMDMDVKQYLTK